MVVLTYRSRLRSDSSSSGPRVGSPSTMEPTTSPDRISGNCIPNRLMSGFTATRKACLSTTAGSASPLARAVRTYSSCSPSSMLARVMRTILASPSVPITSTGSTSPRAASSSLPRLHGASTYSGENSPCGGAMSKKNSNPTSTSSARKKLGIDRPMKAATLTA